MRKRARTLPILAQNVRFFREARGLSRKQLSERLGGYPVIMIEHGWRRDIREATRNALAKALGVSVADLYTDRQFGAAK